MVKVTLCQTRKYIKNLSRKNLDTVLGYHNSSSSFDYMQKGGGDRLWNRPFSQLSDLLDPGWGHIAYHRVVLINIYLQILKFRSNRTNFLWADGQWDIRITFGTEKLWVFILPNSDPRLRFNSFSCLILKPPNRLSSSSSYFIRTNNIAFRTFPTWKCTATACYSQAIACLFTTASAQSPPSGWASYGLPLCIVSHIENSKNDKRYIT